MTARQTLQNTKPAPKVAKLTPMMRQYMDIKAKFADAILLYRLGDFYEMFHDDAVTASKVLDLTLTKRNKTAENPIPLCGMPYHAAEPYIAKLVSKGFKVAICEQVEDPKLAQGIVKREVTRVLTPGALLNEHSLNAKENNFLLSIMHDGEAFLCALCDISTGSFEYFYLERADQIMDEVMRSQVREVIYPEKMRAHLPEEFASLSVYHHAVSDLYYDADFAGDLLKESYGISDLLALGLTEKENQVSILGGMLGYLQEIKVLAPGLLVQPVKRTAHGCLELDESTIRNLELFRTLRDDGATHTLLWHLDSCQTSMGSRKLGEYLRAPLCDLKQISARHEAVEELLANKDAFENLRDILDHVSDLERLTNRFVAGSANARDATALCQSLQVLPDLKSQLDTFSSSLLQLDKNLEPLTELSERIAKTIVDEPPVSVKESGLIRPGVHAELDELRIIERSGKDVIVQIEAKEKKQTGIPSLKVRYNNVFGYYIEVTNTHKDKVPEHYVRKQTLTNAERYITEELKEYESKVLGAAERIKVLEYEVFCDLREYVQLKAKSLKRIAASIAVLDVLQSFAWVAQKYRYVKPQMSENKELNLIASRHPILERIVDDFIPNDIQMSDEDFLMIITGPNMAGKSTVMRTTALVAIMAQIGSFVPCEQAVIGVCDRVFTRVGAHDHLQQGLSTFMVEMVETAKILREATEKSLVLLDEIGRGTSTFDGLSIAWAVAEDIHDRVGARTLFATHYHELCDLAEQKTGINNYHVAIKEWNDQIIFMHKLKKGGTNRSYGVTVASMAGLPDSTINRAHEILGLLELKDLSFKAEVDQTKQEQMQMPLFAAQESEQLKKIKQVDLNALTPLEALNFLAKLKSEL
jgi:DNA mismatch repair protein MutS